MTTKQAIGTAITTLAVTFNREVTRELLAAWELAIGDLTPEQIGKAMGAALKTCKFFPSPAELRAFVVAPRNLVTEAATAWAAVRKAIDRIDYTTASIDFGSHVNAVIRQFGGWDALCRATLTDLDVWKRKEFERLYLAFADAEPGDMGGVLEGAWKHGHHAVAIAGIPSQPQSGRALPAPDNGVSELVRDLADLKAVGGAR